MVVKLAPAVSAEMDRIIDGIAKAVVAMMVPIIKAAGGATGDVSVEETEGGLRVSVPTGTRDVN